MKESFDHAAQNYDDVFTNSAIGKLQRERTYFWLNKIQFFNRVSTVFEVNCGTGKDADVFYEKGLKVIATDGSSEMISYSQSHRNENIQFFQLDFKNIATGYQPANAIFSNFGGLNCLNHTELEEFSKTVEQLQNKNELLIWVIMPKICLMETLYFLAKFKFGALFRRHTDEALDTNVEGEMVKTYYHSPKAVRKMLAPSYRILQSKPVALFLPPSYLEPFFLKRKGLLNTLNSLEKLFGRFSLFARWSDHYIIIAEKK